MKRKAFSVSGLNRYLSQLIKADPLLSFLAVEGEITGWKVSSAGHAYFQLKDESAQVDCVLFSNRRMALDQDFSDGDHVRITGRAGLYERAGRFQINVDQMERVGLGKLYEAFLRERDKYQSLGYFDEERKRKLPHYPRRIGIVSSEKAAALQDVLSVLRRRNPTIDVILYPSLVQGEGASNELARGLDYFSGRPDIDLVILTRGGGSLEDLWAFNEGPVVEAIAASRVPVVSAVGHETDFTLADFVADLRAPTPSAAAELVTPTGQEMKDLIKGMLDQLQFRCALILERQQSALDERLLLDLRRPIDDLIRTGESDLASLMGSLESLLEKRMVEKTTALQSAGDLLDAQNPLKKLKKGYGYIEKDHRPLESTGDLARGDSLQVRLYDGTFDATVTQIRRDSHGEKHL